MAPRPGTRPSPVDDAQTRRPLLKVTGPAELAQAVPYLLGFHPRDSLVTVGLRGGRVVVTARVDLADVVDPVEPVSLPATLAAMARSEVTQVVALVYDDAGVDPADPSALGDLPWRVVADRLASAATVVGLELDEAALISGGRLWSYLCDDPRCCPPQGRPVDTDTAVAATAAYAGLVALPDRASLAALLARRIDPALAADRAAALAEREREADRVGEKVSGRRAAGERTETRRLCTAARAFDRPGSTDVLGDDERTRYALALRRTDVRDELWLSIDEGSVDGRALWRRLATTLPAPWDAAPLFLFAWASYRAGDGALARIAAERALDSDPQYSAADIVLAALDQALDPHQLPRLRRRRVRAGRRGAAPGAADPTPR